MLWKFSFALQLKETDNLVVAAGAAVYCGRWRVAIRDAEGEVYFSSEGCTQGDPLGPFLFAVGYHWQLLEVQAMHPGATILCYL